MIGPARMTGLSDDPLDRFLGEYFQRRPVNATFTGDHRYDERLPDWSEHGLTAADDHMRRIVAQLDEQYPTPARVAAHRGDARLLDAELMRGFCEIQVSENASAHGPRGNPALWTGEAVFSVISLMVRDFAPLLPRVRSATARMNAIPAFLAQARETLSDRALPAPWVARARRDCDGAAILFTRGIELWTSADGLTAGVRSRANATASEASQAMREFADWLSQRPAAAENAMQCGSAHYDLVLRRGHQCSRPRGDLLADARQRLESEHRRLDEMAREAAGSWAAVQERLGADCPPPDRYLATFEQEWRACREAILDADVVTWPDWPIHYDEIPPFTREAAPYLYYLFYRSPAPLDPYTEHTYVVAPGWNRSTIRLNHVLHHGGVGHHLQNWHAYHRAPTRVGKIAAVDCANRIGMFCGGTMAEGWACYATTLMGEIGALTPLELVAEQQSRVRQLARAVIDLAFHAGEISFNEAVAIFRDRTGATEAVARAEVVKCSMFPGTAVMYWLGTQGILDLREQLRARAGARFSLRQFHDDLLGHGSIPVPLVSRMLLGADA